MIIWLCLNWDLKQLGFCEREMKMSQIDGMLGAEPYCSLGSCLEDVEKGERAQRSFLGG